MAEKSTRTKMIEEAPAEGTFSKAVRAGMAGISSLADKVGLTQEKEYAGKTKEELAVKKAKGGYVRSADGCAIRGKTKGRIV